MKLAIIGSRTIDNIHINDFIKEKPDCIISGGAAGVDTIAWAGQLIME
jgi:predicted Rossmann fold nucleotide-binding protein DprA/Smf involved in DNA uptake